MVKVIPDFVPISILDFPNKSIFFFTEEYICPKMTPFWIEKEKNKFLNTDKYFLL